MLQEVYALPSSCFPVTISAVSPNWFSPTEEWLNKYKITQLRLLAKKLDVDVLPTDNKKMVMHRLLAAFSEGAEFDPIKFLEEVK